jgi:hypothetical protein
VTNTKALILFATILMSGVVPAQAGEIVDFSAKQKQEALQKEAAAEQMQAVAPEAALGVAVLCNSAANEQALVWLGMPQQNYVMFFEKTGQSITIANGDAQLTTIRDDGSDANEIKPFFLSPYTSHEESKVVAKYNKDTKICTVTFFEISTVNPDGPGFVDSYFAQVSKTKWELRDRVANQELGTFLSNN